MESMEGSPFLRRFLPEKYFDGLLVRGGHIPTRGRDGGGSAGRRGPKLARTGRFLPISATQSVPEIISILCPKIAPRRR